MENSARKACQDDDVDEDHYFLPGGILDAPSHEEDMIGGSLLDEIGGVGNVAIPQVRVLPPKQMSGSRIVGSGPRTEDPSGTMESIAFQIHRKATNAVRGGPTRLSVEGTNPMAKEFKPSACPDVAGVVFDTSAGGPRTYTETQPSSKVFSAAVGSEVKTAVLEQPYHGAMQRLPRNLSKSPESALSPQPAAQVPSEERGHKARHTQQQQETAWPLRALALPAQSGPPRHSKHRRRAENDGHQSPPPGFPPRGVIQAEANRVHSQGVGISTGSMQRRERTATLRQCTDGTLDLNERVSSPKAGARLASVSHTERPLRRNRNQATVRRTQPPEHFLSPIRNVTNASTNARRDNSQEESGGRTHRARPNQSFTKGSSRERIHSHQAGTRRMSHDQTNSPRQDIPVKATSPRKGVFGQDAAQSAEGSRGRFGRGDYSHLSAPSLFTARLGQDALSQHQPQGLRMEGATFEEGETTFCGLSHRSSERWAGNSRERSVPQARTEDDTGGHLQSNFNKEKDNRDRSKPKKKEEKAYRPGPKQLLASMKEPNRAIISTRSVLSQRLRVLGAYTRSLSQSIVSAFFRTICWHFNRMRLVGRLLAVLSFAASSGISFLSLVILSIYWLFLVGLRVHSLALNEVTGNVHIAVCFLFPYFFQFLVSVIDEWAPHWLPACLWYSFLMQMLCSSNHMYKHSMSSHLVPALRALLPVAFLCEVPSGRSYLLAMGGSELLLLSFTLAAVRLRCLFSPIFLFSWSSQVFAVATLGPSGVVQYGQLLLSLASLHAVSMVDVMLNSRFYHARTCDRLCTTVSPHRSFQQRLVVGCAAFQKALGVFSKIRVDFLNLLAAS